MTARIVSLVPSLTETLCELGLRDELVGCTKFCVEPPGLQRTAALVGGTKDPDLDAIFALAPTHVLVNDEENKPEHIAALAARVPTLTTFPKDPREVPAMLREMGRFLGRCWAEPAKRIEALAAAVPRFPAKKTFLYYIWREPYMVAARDTYISAMLELAGLENAVPAGGTRYPELTVEAARALKPDLLLLSSEPYPFRKRDVERLRGEWPDAPEILKADGQLFSWYGTRAEPALAALAAWVEGRPQALAVPF
jgi:ABC-type Fe3+-hydroxamate transport system substrate-binding protein